MAAPTTLKLTAEQAGADGESGFWVLNGAPDGPATRIVQDRAGADVRARTSAQAMAALADEGHRVDGVELQDHEFPDVAGTRVFKLKVWVPRNS